MIFDMGRMVEDLVMQDLREAGLTIVEQQRPFSWPKYQITGSIDCKIAVDGSVYPAEIKSAAPYAFDSINTIEDMKHHRWHYMRKYPAQLTLYLLMDNKDKGLFIFKNKSTGALKEIWMSLDYALGESLIQKAEAVNRHIAEGTLPPPIDYSEELCGDCGYQHICMPARIGTEVQVSDDGELLELVTRYNALKPGAKEFDEVDKRINELVKGREKVLVGDWFVEGHWCDRKGYDIPAEIKAQYQTVTQYWSKKIAKVSN